MRLIDRAHGAAIAAGLALRAIGIRPPKPTTLTERLATLPLANAPVAHPVRIRWDRHAIPWIEAQSDPDLATGLGIAHAHLRLGQLDLMRRLATGRLSEAAGPLAIELDRTIHLIDLGRAVPGIIAGLPPASRAWAEAFVAGLNHVIAANPRPYEARLLGTEIHPFTLTEFFYLARLVSADISWVVAARLLRARNRAGGDWPRIWPRLLAGGAPVDFTDPEDVAADLLGRHMRAGSNSAALAGQHAAGGAALIASDPHLGLGLPNTTLLAGLRSPTTEAVGLMFPGMPFVALGRNRHGAWGGTSLHAASSEFIDVSGLPADAFTTRQITLPVRGARPTTLALRETAYGPVVSDGLLLKSERPIALRWVGHQPSDELTAMLGVQNARSFEDFTHALNSFALPGQTMVWAGADGRVGKTAAVHMPRRRAPPTDVTTPPALAWDFTDIAPGADMPVWADPPDGIAVSANERPDRGDIPLGFFFSPPDRANRLRAILAVQSNATAEDMKALQRDVLHPAALAIRDRLLPLLHDAPASFADAFRAWDGRYTPHSGGALAFELFLGHLLTALFPADTRAGFDAVWGTRLLLLEDLAGLAPADVAAARATALGKAVTAWTKLGTWGAAHRYRPRHHFAALPLLGRRFPGPDFPAPGGDDTIHKTGHGLTTGAHTVRFGACARHVSDLADPDANFFCILGGQDGWLNSANFFDQALLWRDGDYVQVGMTEAAIARATVAETILTPSCKT